jgi:hypothetical protein
LKLNNLKIKVKLIYFLCLIGFILLGLFAANSAEIDPYPTVNIPIFKGGYNLQKYLDASKATKSVGYYVQSVDPPAEVLEFYDAYFIGRGWRPSFEICQRNWEDLRKGTKTAGPLSRQLFASWEHSEFHLKAALWLTYEMVNQGRQNEVTVKCRLMPKADI